MSGIWRRRVTASIAMPVLAEPQAINAAILVIAPIWISSGRQGMI